MLRQIGNDGAGRVRRRFIVDGDREGEVRLSVVLEFDVCHVPRADLSVVYGVDDLSEQGQPAMHRGLRMHGKLTEASSLYRSMVK